MIPIVIYSKQTEIPSGNCYVIAKDGVYLQKDTGLISGIVKVDKLSFLKEVIARAEIKIPPISLEQFLQVRMFFRAVYNLYRSEAIVLLYYNEASQEYLISVPEQTVHPSGLKYIPEKTEKDYKLVGSIHSHANFSAFHSNIDHKDEANFDGLHITIGNVNKRNFSLSLEVAINNNRFKQEPEEWIIGIAEKKLILETSKRYHFILEEGKTMKDYSFPQRWLKKVKEMVYEEPVYPEYFKLEDKLNQNNPLSFPQFKYLDLPKPGER